jgi:hypothetical protein
MTPAEIDLCVDRLCSFWPTTNIARNTLKNGWKHSEIIIDATSEHGKQVLADCKPLPKFPDLNAIEAMFRKVMNRQLAEIGCDKCGNTGFIEGTPIQQLGFTYRTSQFCSCRRTQ